MMRLKEHKILFPSPVLFLKNILIWMRRYENKWFFGGVLVPDDCYLSHRLVGPLFSCIFLLICCSSHWRGGKLLKWTTLLRTFVTHLSHKREHPGGWRNNRHSIFVATDLDGWCTSREALQIGHAFVTAGYTQGEICLHSSIASINWLEIVYA